MQVTRFLSFFQNFFFLPCQRINLFLDLLPVDALDLKQSKKSEIFCFAQDLKSWHSCFCAYFQVTMVTD